MTRLYTLTRSDRRRDSVGMGANEKMEIDVYYGSTGDSKYYGKVTITWHKEDIKPSIDIVGGESNT